MRKDDSFAAAYKMKNGAVGLIIYKMDKDGTMDGVWTLTGKDGAGTEVLTPNNKLSFYPSKRPLKTLFSARSASTTL